MSALTPPAPSEGLGAPPAAPPATLPALPALPAAKTLGVVHSSTVHVVVADSELELRLSLQRPSPRRMDYAYMCERNAFIDPNAGGCRARAASPPPRLFGTAPQSPPPPQQQQQQQQQQQPQHAAKLRPLTLAGSARDQKARLWSSAAPTPGALPTFRPPTWAASQSARQRAACARGAAPPPLSTAAAAQALVPRWRQLLDEWGSPPPVDTAAQLGSVVGAPRFADRDGRQSRQRARGLKGERELALLARPTLERRTLISTSPMLLTNLVPCLAVISSAHALNVLPGGESAPSPRKYGSTTVVSLAEGHEPSSICLPWYHPMPRLGTPQPTCEGAVRSVRRGAGV